MTSTLLCGKIGNAEVSAGFVGLRWQRPLHGIQAFLSLMDDVARFLGLNTRFIISNHVEE